MQVSTLCSKASATFAAEAHAQQSGKSVRNLWLSSNL
jgi:hypothetical protein